MRGHEVALFFRAAAAFGAHHDGGHALFVGRIGDHPLRHAGDFVHLLLQRDAFREILEVNLAADFGQDREGVRIPLEQDVVDLHLGAVLEQHLGAVHHRVALFLAPLVVDDGHDAVAVHGNQLALGVLDGDDVEELDEAVGLGVLLGLLARSGGRAADVEGTHGELRSGLADGLRGNDAHRFAALHHASGGEVAAVAELADAALGFAGEHRADLDALDTGGLDRGGQVFGDLLVQADDHVAFVVVLIFERDAADDAVAQRLDDFARFDDGLDVNAVAGAAIGFGDDDVLRHVAQAAGEVAGVGRLQSRVGQTLARAVRGDEVLQHVQAFAEVGGDGLLDDFARGLGHQAAHAGELADLLFRSAGAGVGHDVNRIEVAAGAVVLFHGLEHFVGDSFGDLRPDFDDLVVALALGDGAFLILLPTSMTAFSASRTSLAFSPGTTMSSMPMEMPARVAYRKPSFFTSSSIWTVICRPNFR